MTTDFYQFADFPQCYCHQGSPQQTKEKPIRKPVRDFGGVFVNSECFFLENKENSHTNHESK